MTGPSNPRKRRRDVGGERITPLFRFPERPAGSGSGFDVAERIAASARPAQRDAA